MRAGVSGVDAVIFVDEGLIVPSGSKAGRNGLGFADRPAESGILAVVVKDKRLVAVLLRPQGACHIL